MKRLHILTIIIIALAFSNSLFADWKADLDSLIKADNPEAQKRFLEKVVEAGPDYSEVSTFIENISFPERQTGVFLIRAAMCIDGVKRPYLLYIPPSYDPTIPTPLFVILHDRVRRSSIIEDPEKYAREHDFQKFIVEKNGWLGLYPLGQRGATWWDSVGMANITNLIHLVKREYNVDDNRVFLGGIGDGASGAYGLAMLAPTDFAAIIGLYGDLTLPNRLGNLPTFISNLANTFIFMGLEKQSDLNRYSAIFALTQLLRNANAKIKFTTPGSEGDSLTYDEMDYERIRSFLSISLRPCFLPLLSWETADPAYGSFQWFSIDEINRYKPAAWHKDHNTEVLDSSIALGFIRDDRYAGPGIRVLEIIGGESLAQNCDLKPGDIILKGNDDEIKTPLDFEQFEQKLYAGGAAVLMIERNGQQFVIYGAIPPPKRAKLLQYDRLSSQAMVSRTGNLINIDASRMEKCTIRILPALFELNKNMQVIVEGNIIFNQMVEPDLEFMLRNFLENRDRKLLYIASLSFEL